VSNSNSVEQLASEFFTSGNKDNRSESSPPRFTVLTSLEPGVVSSRVAYTCVRTEKEVLDWMRLNLRVNSIVAFDVETRGLEAHLDDTCVVGFSLSTETSAIYFQPHTIGAEKMPGSQILRRLAQLKCRIIAHNLFFDGHWIRTAHPELFSQLNFHRCTYMQYKMMATEGWPGQTWGLKDAQIQLLGWTETNEIELDRWLVMNGHVKGSVSKEFSESMTAEQRWEYYNSPDNLNTKGAKKVQVAKGEMWRAPFEILGKYCCLDSYSTIQLYSKVLTPVEERFLEFPRQLDAFMELLIHLINQKVRGIQIDVSKLLKYRAKLDSQVREAHQKFIEHEDVASGMSVWVEQKMQDYYSKEPPMYRKKKLSKEPAQFKKNGETSRVWLKWCERRDMPPEISKSWINWTERRAQAESDSQLNINSDLQLCWLFYDFLKFPVAKTTESGERGIDKKVIHLLGEPGRLLAEYGALVKELQYVDACVAHTDGMGILRPSFRVPGTLTGRLSGSGGINLQQVPKSREYLECYTARPGYKWVQCDMTALEKFVLTELSRDETLLGLYGPDARPGQDVYLHDGAFLPGFMEPLREAGYDPKTSSAEFTAKIKKEFKSLRKLIKVPVLGFGYNLGPKKYRRDMATLGIEMTEDEAFAVYKAYWDLYKGVKVWEKELKRQHTLNRGWVLDGLGVPIGVYEDLIRDVVNRVCQRTGHSILVYWIQIFSRQLRDAGIEWHPIIIDFHDESIIEVPAEQAERALEILESTSFEELNRMLNSYIPLKGEGLVCDTLADIKIED
jgi:DNA polymerase I-like protein with 3'-5' exonuclease and polymerase domains